MELADDEDPNEGEPTPGGSCRENKGKNESELDGNRRSVPNHLRGCYHRATRLLAVLDPTTQRRRDAERNAPSPGPGSFLIDLDRPGPTRTGPHF